jgi:hypothetical protein
MAKELSLVFLRTRNSISWSTLWRVMHVYYAFICLSFTSCYWMWVYDLTSNKMFGNHLANFHLFPSSTLIHFHPYQNMIFMFLFEVLFKIFRQRKLWNMWKTIEIFLVVKYWTSCTQKKMDHDHKNHNQNKCRLGWIERLIVFFY